MSAGTVTTGLVEGARWTARPWLARLVRVLVALLPVLAGIVTAAVASRTLEHPRPGTLPWWLCVFALATAASVLVATAARRLLPLAALLQLALVFPDHTPSRFRMALRAGSTGRLQRQVSELREHGVLGDANSAAETVLELATAINVHDSRTRGHSERVRALSELIAEEMHLSTDDLDRLRWAALLHDCGKLMVHSDVLNKRDTLNDEEWAEVRRHPLEGARLAAPLAPWLGPWALAIEEHHERWDGYGYPHGRAGTDISLGARIVAVADSFEVMTAARSYQRPVTADAARTELAREAGHQFDPDVVRAFLAVSIGRLRWLVGPVSWMAELPVIRTAAQAPTVTAPAALTAMTLAAVSVLGVVSPPGRSRAAGAPDIVAAAPAPSGPVVAQAPPSDAPVAAVLGTQIEAGALPATPAPSAPTTVVVAEPVPALDAPPSASPAAVCVEIGPVSSVVNGAVEPVADQLAPPLGAVVNQADCGVVVPVEHLLEGGLDPSPVAEIVGDLSLLP